MNEMLLQQWLQWLGCGTALSGAALLALNCRLSGYGFVLFLISNGFGLAFSWLTKAPEMVVTLLGFTVTSLIGIWAWLVVPAMEHRRLYGRPLFLSRPRSRYLWGKS
jgi:hypothetical protein